VAASSAAEDKPPDLGGIKALSQSGHWRDNFMLARSGDSGRQKIVHLRIVLGACFK